jgi:putative heme-binding domain-containing protein
VHNKSLPSSWLNGLLPLLKQSAGATRDELVGWIASMTPEQADAAKVKEVLLALSAQQPTPSAKWRLLRALPPGSALADRDLEQLLVSSFLGEHGVETAGEAGNVLARVELGPSAAEQLIAGLGQVQPLQLMQGIASVAALKHDELDERLLAQLAKLPAARTLPLDQLTSLYRNRSDVLKREVASTVELLGKPPADVEAKLDALLAQLKSGDVARGFQVFRGTKAACSACHRIGYVGGQIGPELTRIGATRTRRALLEAIVFPSARLEQSYAPLRVLTTDGQVLNGLVARDSGGVLELITGATQRVTIAHDDIEQRLPSPVSIMPAGLEQQLTLDELADLLTMLEAAR